MFGYRLISDRKFESELQVAKNKAYVEGFNLGRKVGEFEGLQKNYTTNQIREAVGMKPINDPDMRTEYRNVTKLMRFCKANDLDMEERPDDIRQVVDYIFTSNDSSVVKRFVYCFSYDDIKNSKIDQHDVLLGVLCKRFWGKELGE